jgi:ATP-binding cassette, subfamily B, bacterial MsbA
MPELPEKPKNKIQKIIQEFRDNKGVLMQLLHYVKPYRMRYFVGILCGAGFNFINGAIMLLIYFVGQAVFVNTGDADLTPPTIPHLGPLNGLNGLIHYIAVNILHLDHVSRYEGLIAACIVIPTIMMIRSVLDYCTNYIGIWVGNKVLIDIRSDLMKHITSQSLDYFNEMRAGTLIQRVFNETMAMQGVFFMLSQQINQPIAILTGIACLLKINWLFTLGALVLLPCVIAPVLSLGKKIRRSAHSEQLERGEMMVILHEMISGIKVIKSFARTDHEVKRFNASSQTQFRQIMRV